MLNTLSIEGHTPCPTLPWLEESWSDPASFFRAISEGHATSLPSRPKSVVLERYDAHFDLICRNNVGDREAFRWQDQHDEWQALSCAELEELSARRAGKWAAYGVEAGQTLCIILPFGPEWVISFLSAVRLGCVVSFLPPAGPLFYAKRLTELSPDHIATADLYGPSLGEFRAQAIPSNLPPGDGRRQTFVHASGGIFANLFSPLAEGCHIPIPLSIDEAYCCALRDGLLVYGLRPGDTLAAPGADLLQYQPALLLATLLAGGIYVHVELEAVERNPVAFAALELTTVGVMPRLRDLLLDAGVQVGKSWSHWWRGVNEESDALRWSRFTSEAGLSTVPGSNVFIDASTGGATFFSARRSQPHGGMSSLVFPAAGIPWSLAPLSGSIAPGAGAGLSMGVFTPHTLVDDEPRAGSHILHRHQAEWFYLGVSHPTREGREYPKLEVLDCLSRFEFVEGATVVAVPTADVARPFAFALVVFVGRGRSAELAREQDAWKRVIEAAIVNGLGPSFAPNRIELFAFSPRWNEEQVDEAWCHEQYVVGGLHERATREVFILLDDLRELVTATGPGSMKGATA